MTDLLTELKQRHSLITRKEVARLIGVSTAQVRDNEQRWGLRAFRNDLNSRNVRYRPGALDMLITRGFIIP